MKTQKFLEHHGIARNPFSEEDAQSDPVFKDHCITDTYHPSWDKIYGEPSEPATSIVFGEKGAGKTAMRLQITRHLDEHNRTHANQRLFTVQYDDFNPFLDRFANRLPLRRRRIDRVLASWRLWDHMDAVLSLGVTKLVHLILVTSKANGDVMGDIARLDRHQRRDLLLLAACYDQSTHQPIVPRWHALRRKLHFWPVKALCPFAVGVTVTLLTIAAGIAMFVGAGNTETVRDLWDRLNGWLWLPIVIGWAPWLWKFVHRLWLSWGIARGLRVISRPVNPLRKLMMMFTTAELAGQPLPNRDRTDDRYELLTKFQGILQTLGYSGIFVLVDRVDEPYLVNGSAELMKALIWPLLDNKFLKHPGLGVKLMLPAELKYFVEREGREFQQRARLDKQNMIPSLAWTGEALYDIANARLRACASNGKQPNIGEFFEETVTHERLLDGFRSLRVPRHLHKFLYRLLVSHCNSYTDEEPHWQIPKERFEAELALYEREMNEGP